MNEQLLVSTEWLEAHLDDPHLRIIDIRGHVLPASQPPPHYFNHRDDYDRAHIPGAVFVDWVHEITDPDDPRHARIARQDRFAAAMSRCGIDDNTFVVAYDDAASMFAARLWWALNYYGHTQVAVLDGGWTKWTAESRPTTPIVPQIAPAHFTARPQAELFRDADAVAAGMNAAARLLDLRSAAEYAGKESRAKRMGHIPGALSSPRANLTAPDGTLLPPAALRAYFTQIGLNDPDQEIITYCNAGVSASFGLLALRAAGFYNSAMYDGSWKDWGNDDSRPIE